jgi:hypothetical protein
MLFATAATIMLACSWAYAGTPAVVGAQRSSNCAATRRTLHFPSGKALGAIWVGNEKPVFGPYKKYIQVAGASGDVTITVPKGQRVLFEANRRVFENPACLTKISPVGIDCIKMGFISLEDREDDMCDKALAYIPSLNGIAEINIDRSEATDKGLSQLKRCTSLKGISCFMSSVDGSCFKDLVSLPSLKGLWVPRCMIDQKNMAYLPHFSKLRELDLERTQLDASGAKYLAQCPRLEVLVVRGNPKFDDNCLKFVVPLKNLCDLDVRETPVTISGLKTLKLSKLIRLGVPQSMSKNLPELKRLFPLARINAASRTLIPNQRRWMTTHLYAKVFCASPASSSCLV